MRDAGAGLGWSSPDHGMKVQKTLRLQDCRLRRSRGFASRASIHAEAVRA
ncbi:hypothetical protein BRPE64_BCDS04260 [Caballeronia insecticola]|uniref:Uncharacterized protein n=1 Tax=Caballeronia insecticola TaxID=758793 RepID=R4X1K8_9BURK|nr:hypothetical protein BRPE64_BCDS04260 [Caballeronia insecticola]